MQGKSPDAVISSVGISSFQANGFLFIFDSSFPS